MLMEKIHVTDNLIATNLPKCVKGPYSDIKKEEIIMNSLMNFYNYPVHLERLLPILTKRSKISLRVLDWFVTNYSKEFRTRYKITLYGRTKEFYVHDSYKAQLQAFHKKLFDPFCRRRRIYFEYSDGYEIETTPGQLNFFRWAIQNNVIDYVCQHIERISFHMSIKNKDRMENRINISGEIEKDKNNTIIAKIGFNQNLLSPELPI